MLPPFLTAFPRAVEIDRPCCSRKDSRRDGSIHTLSRTDRIFTIFPMAELRDFQCQSHTVETVGDRSIPSDHVRVRLIIECPRNEQSDHPVILRWLAKHPLFDCVLHEEHRNMMYGSRRWRPVRVARYDRPFWLTSQLLIGANLSDCLYSPARVQKRVGFHGLNHAFLENRLPDASFALEMNVSTFGPCATCREPHER